MAVAAVIACAGGAQAQPEPREARAPHTSVELVAASEAFDAKGELWVGVRFRLDKDWHLYWRNPGDSGAPPTVAWRLPRGVTAGDVVWAAPERIALGPIVNYGYYGDVVLPVRLKRAAGTRGPLVVGADLKWLVCHEICVPGKASLALSVPVPTADRAQVAGWRQRIDQARSREPKPAPSAWRTVTTSLRDHFVVRIDLDRPAEPAMFFPIDAGLLNESAPQGVTAKERTIEFMLKKSDQLVTEPRTLTGVVTLKSGASFVVTAPVGRTAGSGQGKQEE